MVLHSECNIVNSNKKNKKKMSVNICMQYKLCRHMILACQKVADIINLHTIKVHTRIYGLNYQAFKIFLLHFKGNQSLTKLSRTKKLFRFVHAFYKTQIHK